MSGSRVPHLQRRNGTFYLRVRVPDDLRLRVGLREVRRSLGVYTISEARPLALKYAARVMKVFEVTKNPDLTKADVRSLVHACFSDLKQTVEGGFVPRSVRPDIEVDYQRALFEDHTVHVSAQLDAIDFHHPVTTQALQLLRRAGFKPEDVAEDRLVDLCSGVARALLERDRLFHFRLSDRLSPYIPSDPLFAALNEGEQRTSQSADPHGEKLGVAVQTYLEEGRSQWAAKTYKDRAKKLSYLVEHIGADRVLATIASQDIVSYRDAVRRLRKQSKRTVNGSFASQLTDDDGARVSITTAENIFVPCKAFFAWAKGHQGLISVNPADGVRFPKAKAAKRSKARRPFKVEEVKKLFSAPVFTGMKSHRRRFEAGSLVLRDAHFWLPVLGYYTGARLGELVQLHLSDVHLDGPIPYVDITEEGGDGKGSGHEKSVKSDAGVRKVPLHPDVLTLGFATYVAQVSKQRRGKRLFWQVGFGADGQASTVFSKWFARLMDKAGLPDPGLVFHSFRHTAEDAFKNALVPQYVTDRIIGHAGGAVSDHYGEGVALEVCHEALCKAKLPISLVEIIE